MHQFLDAVVLVSELEASDAALVEAARTLWARLARAEDLGRADATEPISRELLFVGVLRRAIAEEIANIRARESLQVLGRDPVIAEDQ